MQAATLQDLLNFSGNFRAGAVTVARANGIENIWTEMQLGNKTSPRAEVFFTLGEPTGHKTPLAGLTPKEYPYDAYGARLTWSVISNRSTNGAEHEAMCATIRAIMTRFRLNFGEDVLPFYEINMAKPGANAEMVNKDMLDVTQLPYALHFSVRGGAWPSFG